MCSSDLVIARPFTGTSGNWQRTSHRRDYSIAPPGETLLDALSAAGIPRTGVGKVDDLFARRGLEGGHTTGNPDGIARIGDWLASGSGFLFANLVDFDQLYGHRNDVSGFYNALQAFDAALPALVSALHEDDVLLITADHGNDPTTRSSDHAITGPSGTIAPARTASVGSSGSGAPATIVAGCHARVSAERRRASRVASSSARSTSTSPPSRNSCSHVRSHSARGSAKNAGRATGQPVRAASSNAV